MATKLADDIARPAEVADALGITEMALAQMRYRGTGPKFVKRGSRVLYRWSEVSACPRVSGTGPLRCGKP